MSTADHIVKIENATLTIYENGIITANPKIRKMYWTYAKSKCDSDRKIMWHREIAIEGVTTERNQFK